MPNIRYDQKKNLKSCSKTAADLSRTTGIEYRRLSGALNGYWYLRPEEDLLIRKTIEEWLKENKLVK